MGEFLRKNFNLIYFQDKPAFFRAISMAYPGGTPERPPPHPRSVEGKQKIDLKMQENVSNLKNFWTATSIGTAGITPFSIIERLNFLIFKAKNIKFVIFRVRGAIFSPKFLSLKFMGQFIGSIGSPKQIF